MSVAAGSGDEMMNELMFHCTKSEQFNQGP